MTAAVLEVRDLTVSFPGEGGALPCVDGVDLTIAAGRTLGLVGESGSGKSLTALAVIGLVPRPGRVVAGSIRLDGRELSTLPERELRRVRGRDVAMVFQEPMTSLNPVFTVGHQIGEVLSAHRGLRGTARERRVEELLDLVRIPDPRRRKRDHPALLSGGMRQRVMIAMALACEPKVLLADEPTTALDVTIQAEILALLAELEERLGTAILLITHDLAVVAETAGQVAVMYAGRIVERGPTHEVLEAPRHPYTAGLLAGRPGLVPPGSRLATIPGSVPAPGARPSGCAFRDRCPRAAPDCAVIDPRLDGAGDREHACLHPLDGAAAAAATPST